jgi:predicted nucleic acid-binding Zn ribbon protein
MRPFADARPGDPPRPLGEILKAVLRRKRVREKGRYSALVAAWEDIVGEGVASRTHIGSFDDGELVVQVDSAALLHELNSFMKDQLLAGLRATDGGRDVASLRFRLRPGDSALS